MRPATAASVEPAATPAKAKSTSAAAAAASARKRRRADEDAAVEADQQPQSNDRMEDAATATETEEEEEETTTTRVDHQTSTSSKAQRSSVAHSSPSLQTPARHTLPQSTASPTFDPEHHAQPLLRTKRMEEKNELQELNKRLELYILRQRERDASQGGLNHEIQVRQSTDEPTAHIVVSGIDLTRVRSCLRPAARRF
jgi:hypothetical protein